VLRLRSAAVAGMAAEADRMEAEVVAAFMEAAVAEDFTEAVEADSTATDLLEAVVRAAAGRSAADAAAGSVVRVEDRLADRAAGRSRAPAEERAAGRLAREAEAAEWDRRRARADLAAGHLAHEAAGDLAAARGDLPVRGLRLRMGSGIRSAGRGRDRVQAEDFRALEIRRAAERIRRSPMARGIRLVEAEAMAARADCLAAAEVTPQAA
jgi:hypothetical protein